MLHAHKTFYSSASLSLCTEKNYYRIKIKSRHGISPVENKHKIFVADIIRIKGENEHELKM
jgi:hypothetical protein